MLIAFENMSKPLIMCRKVSRVPISLCVVAAPNTHSKEQQQQYSKRNNFLPPSFSKLQPTVFLPKLTRAV